VLVKLHKKLEKELRDYTRNIQNLERSKDKAEETINSLNKETSKSKDELSTTNRKKFLN